MNDARHAVNAIYVNAVCVSEWSVTCCPLIGVSKWPPGIDVVRDSIKCEIAVFARFTHVVSRHRGDSDTHRQVLHVLDIWFL